MQGEASTGQQERSGGISEGRWRGMSGITYEMVGQISGEVEQWVATRHWGRVADRGPLVFAARAEAEAWAIPPRLRKWA